MDFLKIITQSEQETMTVAAKLSALLNPGDVILLEGNLGAGKTTFTKGIAAGIGVKRTVTSPTFTIIKEYEGQLPLYHMDAYRLKGSDEDIGFDEYFNGKGISVVEWAQFIEDYLPKEVLEIEIKHIEENIREIIFKAKSTYFKSVISKIEKNE